MEIPESQLPNAADPLQPSADLEDLKKARDAAHVRLVRAVSQQSGVTPQNEPQMSIEQQQKNPAAAATASAQPELDKEALERHRLQARLWSYRYRERKRALADKLYNETFGCADIKLEKVDSEEEATVPLQDPLQDPLQVAYANIAAEAEIKEEPCEVDCLELTANAEAADPLLNNRLLAEIDQCFDNEKDEADSAHCERFSRVKKARIARALKRQQQMQADTKEEWQDNDSLSAAEERTSAPTTQAERARLTRAEKRALETPEETARRKAAQRLHAQRSRLKKKALREGMLSEDGGDFSAYDLLTKEEAAKRRARIARAQRHKFLEEQAPNLLAEHRKKCAERQRERRVQETAEETEARRLRSRILKMKTRLAAQLNLTEEEQEAERLRRSTLVRQLRQQRRQKETPEQMAARKRRQAQQARYNRMRLHAIESAEETAARKAVQRQYFKKRYYDVRANETPEERIQRKERQRQEREKQKLRKLAKQNAATSAANACHVDSTGQVTVDTIDFRKI